MHKVQIVPQGRQSRWSHHHQSIRKRYPAEKLSFFHQKYYKILSFQNFVIRALNTYIRLKVIGMVVVMVAYRILVSAQSLWD